MFVVYRDMKARKKAMGALRTYENKMSLRRKNVSAYDVWYRLLTLLRCCVTIQRLNF